MTKIWKYPLTYHPLQTVQMPRGSRVLSADQQYGQLVIWAEVDPDAPLFDYTIAAVYTGNDVPDNTDSVYWAFIDTVTASGLVFHIFVKMELPNVEYA